MLVLAFILQVTNNALFFHSHITEGGKTFSHAHPNCGNNHSHSDFQFGFFEQLQLLSLQSNSNLIQECYPQYVISYFEYRNDDSTSYVSHSNKDRAPPIV